MKTIKLNFKNKRGIKLSARLELPVDGKPDAYAVFAHCFTCNINLTSVRNISRALTLNQIGVLLFDFTGLGNSEGDFADTNFSTNVGDLISAVEYLEERDKAPQLLVGHSLGGAAVLLAAAQLPQIKAVATVGAPADPPHVAHLFDNKLEQIEKDGQAQVDIGGRNFTIKKQFIDDLEAQLLHLVIHQLDQAILVLHSPQDKTVGIENAAKIYTAARHPKSFISLDGADHLMSNKADAAYVGHMIAGWAMRYLDIQEEETLETEKQVVVRTDDDGYTTEIRAGLHALIADEPTAVGGNNLGPTPYGLLTAALGSCTSMTLRMYADRKQWPLKEVKVHLSHNKIHAQDCGDCETSEGRIDFIDREIELEGDLNDEQKKRLLEIADRCPVHRTLHGPVKVNTTLKDD